MVTGGSIIIKDGSEESSKVAEEAQYEIQFDTQAQVSNLDVTEAIEVNVDGGLNDRNVSADDPSRFVLVHKLRHESHDDDNKQILDRITYRLIVKNKEVALDVIDDWNNPGTFDDLAFRNAKLDKLYVKIREVKRII